MVLEYIGGQVRYKRIIRLQQVDANEAGASFYWFICTLDVQLLLTFFISPCIIASLPYTATAVYAPQTAVCGIFFV
jgi:hypothetical protein